MVNRDNGEFLAMSITQQKQRFGMKQVVRGVESGPVLTIDRHGPTTILLVDDEDSLREVAKRILRSRGYNVLEAKDGNTCLKIAQEYPGPIHLLVTDLFMPGMSGREVADHLVTLRERTRVLYMSGYTNEAILSHCGLYPGNVFVHKPFSPETFLRKVGESLLAGDEVEV
jgi:CheY-like chemotaxis protein